MNISPQQYFAQSIDRYYQDRDQINNWNIDKIFHEDQYGKNVVDYLLDGNLNDIIDNIDNIVNLIVHLTVDKKCEEIVLVRYFYTDKYLNNPILADNKRYHRLMQSILKECGSILNNNDQQIILNYLIRFNFTFPNNNNKSLILYINRFGIQSLLPYRDQIVQIYPSFNEIFEDSECAICLEPNNEKTVKLFCGHQIHRECLNQLRDINLQNNPRHRSRCPLCRKKHYQKNLSQIDALILSNVYNQ